VAQAARSGEIVHIDDVQRADNWLPNPLLPDTRSEMAIPILVENRVEGVLDVQNDKREGLDTGDAGLLRSLASQVAVAIRNAQLFAQVESALVEAQAAQDRYIGQAWQNVRTQRNDRASNYVHPDMSELSEATLNLARQMALEQQQPAIVALDKYEGSPKPLVAPVTLSGTTIGTLQLHKMDLEDNVQLWNTEDLALVQGVLDQVALAAENLRLFDDTRQRAGREQSLREITEKMRAATSLEELVETASKELGERLAAEHAIVELEFRPDQVALNQ
jgi:GAF domain-containing protein